MVSRARSRTRASGTPEVAAAEERGARTVYYSPFGGKVIAVLEADDPEAEREWDRSGTQWKKKTLPDVPDVKDVGTLVYVNDKNGERVEVRNA